MIRFPFSKPRDPNAEAEEDAAQQTPKDEVAQSSADAETEESQDDWLEGRKDDEWRAEETGEAPAAQPAPFGDRAVELAEEFAADEASALDVGTFENPTPVVEPDGAEAEEGAEPELAEGELAEGELAEGEEGSDHQAAAADGLGRPDLEEQIRMVEAMLFASDKPLSTAELASRMPIGCDAAVAVRRLEEHYTGRGVHLVRVAGKWAFRTAPDLAHLLSDESVEQRKLSRAGIETLAIIAYHQPVTRAEIEEIRQVGVSKGTIDLLMELEWIKLGRRRQTPGRPVTFVTTDKFLEHFGLENVKDLPRLEELRQAGLLDSRPPVGYTPGAGEGYEDDEIEEEDEDEGDDPYGDEEDQQDLLM